MHSFCSAVGKLVLEQYGLEDGADLCFNLVEMKVIDMADGENNAARIVAQHIWQA